MKYILYEKDQIQKEILYASGCGGNDAAIMRALVSYSYVEPFKAKNNICVNAGGIKNDNNMHIMKSLENGNCYIYQVCGAVADCEGFLIPFTYYIRKIGVIIPD